VDTTCREANHGTLPVILSTFFLYVFLPAIYIFLSIMIRINGLGARFAVVALLVFAFLSFLFLGPYDVTHGHLSPKATTGKQLGYSSEAVLTGHAIAPKLGNATAKYVHLAFARSLSGYMADLFIEQNSVARHGKSSTRRSLASLRSLQRRRRRHSGHTYTCSNACTLGLSHTMWRLPAEVMRKLTQFAAENALNTSGRYSSSILPRYRHGQRQRCGAALYTTSSTRG
jgi:hypothetical protein